MTVSWRGDGVKRSVRREAAHGLKLAAEFILEEANRTIPFEEGTLGRSGGTDVDEAKLVASTYYDTKYARRQHEETRYRHDPGRRAKWLELTLREQKDRVRKFLADRLGGSFR